MQLDNRLSSAHNLTRNKLSLPPGLSYKTAALYPLRFCFKYLNKCSRLRSNVKLFCYRLFGL